MNTIPKFLKKYFWDVEFSKLNKKSHSQFIIERILGCGDERAVRWMRNNFKLNEIKDVLCKSRRLSQKSANFWQFIFGLNRNKILCLKKSFQEKQRIFWKY